MLQNHEARSLSNKFEVKDCQSLCKTGTQIQVGKAERLGQCKKKQQIKEHLQEERNQVTQAMLNIRKC